jgi:cell wall-associated NlpC family hydrolase
MCFALSPEYKSSLKKEFSYLIWKHPVIIYVWGDTRPYEGKSDCSGYIYGAYKKAAIPISRTTALEMRKGKAGWYGKDIDIIDADEMDIVWWTWKNKPERPHGHIGVLIENPKSKLLEVTHASSSQKKVVIEPLDGVLIRDLSATRRITIGEKQTPVLGKGITQTK